VEIPSPPSDEVICPNCGETMVQLPTLDGLDYINFCPTCPPDTEPINAEEDIQEPSPPEESIQEVDPRMRFRELIDTSQVESTWPEEMLESLPEDARKILLGKKPTSGSTESEQFSDHLAQSLRDRGYVIDQDSHGVRISGGPRGGLDSETFSPYDVIRMAADLEGGVLPLDERVHCLKCDAVIPSGEGRCQWCGEPAPPPEETSDLDQT
jgi:hypothetical protein